MTEEIKKLLLADYHLHSKFSDDSDEEPEKTILSAIDRGLKEICFTDHVDYGIQLDPSDYRQLSAAAKKALGNPPRLNVDYPPYVEILTELREKYKGRIRIKLGLEFGMQYHWTPAFQKLFDSLPLDFVILSCHQVDDKEFWNNEFQEGRTIAEVNAAYYEEIYKVMENYSDYSVLGHLDAIQRYNSCWYPFSKSRDIIEKILRRAIADGKGIELNTSSFRYGLPDLTPEHDILGLYYELGGEIITLGSDAHVATDVAEGFDLARRELKAIGFKQYTTFTRMEPEFHPL